MMCVLISIFFVGGWLDPIDQLDFLIGFWLVIKTLFFLFLFIYARGTLPRSRYDHLMRLGWKVFLPIALAFVMLLSAWIISFHSSFVLF
jgi:NADH-quinone oxidoreductase subunit H